jgi:hypothetical protein
MPSQELLLASCLAAPLTERLPYAATIQLLGQERIRRPQG